MKERPIIFSSDMVKAILENRKTMTRRLSGLSIINDPPQRDAGWQLVAVFQDGCARFTTPNGNGDITLVCPYGGYGDRLWVRETHYLCVDADQKIRGDVVYKASEKNPDICKGEWRPSIFMPRWASRITLEITDIRVERLQNISHEDCRREGSYMATNKDDEGGFVNLWDSLNGKKYPWESNPWLWLISFRRI